MQIYLFLQFAALFLAFATRKVKIKGLDDAKYIAGAIYVTSIVLAVVIVATYSTKDLINTYTVIFSAGNWIGVTVVLTLVFVTKVRTSLCLRSRLCCCCCC